MLEVNRRFIEEEVKAFAPNDPDRIHRMAIVADGQIRMAHLSVVGSHSVNGVAALHTELLQQRLLRDFAEIYPKRFNNKTNGITPRRWLVGCNPKLSGLVSDAIGDQWITQSSDLSKLSKFAEDDSFRKNFRDIKMHNKEILTGMIESRLGLQVSPEAIFDAQIKRLHEYKRQHLNLLHILTLYRRLLHDPDLDIPPRVFLFGPKPHRAIIWQK